MVNNVQRLRKELQRQKNYIGSLKGDVQKLERSRLNQEQRIVTLQKKITKKTALQQKTTRQLQAVKNSASWKTGYVIVRALTKPGTNTLLLPYRLLKILFCHVKQKNSPPKTAEAEQSTTGRNLTSLKSFKQNKKQKKSFSLRKAISTANLSKLRIASIVDEFTYNCFLPECNLSQLSPANWQQELTSFQPDLLFVEAAWRGKDDLWTGKIKKNAPETRALLDWCHKHEIPTAFWAKEDPSDFDSFLDTAKFFDFIFTTDIDCINKYKESVSHPNVYLLPFAAQPKLHHPVEEFQRKDAFCFAGAYYLHFPERQIDFETLYDVLSKIKDVDIYDRNYCDDRNLFIFPDKYKKSILGNIKNNQINIAYKGYRYAINVNSIKDSGSMFARRVFELLASNTVVLSNYSKGIHSFFGDLVISTDDELTLEQKLTSLINDETYYRKFRLLGLRKVLEEHTYEDRLRYIANKIWQLQHKQLPHVHVLAKAANARELNLVLESFRRQSYTNKSLIIVLEDSFNTVLPEDDTCKGYTRENINKKKIGDVIANDFVAGFVCSDYYGPNYLLDNILATRYSPAPVIGKGSWYTAQANDIQLHNDTQRYTYVDKLPLRSCIFLATLLNEESLIRFLDQMATEEIQNDKCLSIDEFNYLRDSTESACSAVDDLPQMINGRPLIEILTLGT